MSAKNILVVTQWGYEEGLIQSYTLPYLRIIHKVNPEAKIYLVTQEKRGLDQDVEKLGVIKQQLQKENIYLLAGKYYRAGLKKYFFSGINFLEHINLVLTKGIRYIHTFCTPAGGYGYLLAKITGKKLVIDSYEPHSEYMLEASVWNENSFAYKVLSSLEKAQAVRANYLIATTPTIIGHTEQRFGVQLPQYFVKPACVDLDKFYYRGEEAGKKREELGLNNKLVGVYAGKFGDFYLCEEIIEFFREAFLFWGDRFHVLLLSDLKEEELSDFCQAYSLHRENFTLFMAPHHLVPLYLSMADFGFSPYRPTPSKKYCTPIKNGEYWAIGLPVVITRDISVDSDIIERENIGYVLKELNAAEYRNAVVAIDRLLKGDRRELRGRIRKIAETYRSYHIAEMIYRTIYN